MRSDIILIGPLAAGKTSVALYLSARLRIPNYPLDRIKWYYRFRNGYDLARGTMILRTQGFRALLEYADPFLTLHDIERFLAEFEGGIIDFGASHSVFDNSESLEQARQILKPFRNVILLLPSPNPEESIDILDKRIRERYSERDRAPEIVESYVSVNRHFVLNTSNSILAKHTVYTDNKTVEQTGEEVLSIAGVEVPHEREHVGEKPLQALWINGKNFLPPFA